MFGVPIDGYSDALCDNTSVVNNTTLVNSKLHKKYNSLEYHDVRWAAAAQILTIGKMHTQEQKRIHTAISDVRK